MKKLIVMGVALLVGGTLSLRAAEAKEIFAKHCAMCHGKEGKGNTRMGERLGVKDWTSAKVQAGLKDEEMTKDIKDGVKKEGRTKMKAFGSTLSDQEIKDLVAYIRTLKK